MIGLMGGAGVRIGCVALLLLSQGCYSRSKYAEVPARSLGILITNVSTDAIRVYLADDGSYRSLLGVVEAGQTRRLTLTPSEGEWSGAHRRLFVTRTAGDAGDAGFAAVVGTPGLSTELLTTSALTSLSWTVRENSISGLPPRAWTLR